MPKKYLSWPFLFVLCLFLSISPVFGQEPEEDPEVGDEEVFVSVAPDVLILLDTTGSMAWNPKGGSYIYGSSNCAASTTDCGSGFGISCSGGYCQEKYVSRPNCQTNCSRIEIAKRAIFALLDDDGNDIINTQDSNSLGVRVGFMKFGGSDNSLNYASGNIILSKVISNLGATDTGTPYQTTYCGANDKGSCTLASSGSSYNVAGQSASGGTPLTNALREAKKYLDYHKEKDIKANTCRKKFVILISDGADTYACSGDGGECQSHMYKRRRTSVAAAKQLKDSDAPGGYPVYVIAFGDEMPDYLLNTLNWMAYYGGTRNSAVVQSGDTAAYQIPLGCNPSGTAEQKALCCNLESEMTTPVTNGSCFPSGVSACSEDASTETASCYSGGSAVSTGYFKATDHDPGYLDLNGYAFVASNTTQLISALRTAMIEVSSSAYSFTQASIQTIRLTDESYLYEASFSPVLSPNNDSFWPGYLKRYEIYIDENDNKTKVKETPDWDAGAKLKDATAANRKIYTLKSGTMTAFTTDNISETDLALSGGTEAQREAQRQLIIKYIREGEQGGGNQAWKLGDIFHSDPITIGTPSLYFYDRIDQNDPPAYKVFRESNPRTTANEKRLIVAGTNNAQFHVFKAADNDKGGGSEVWSFVPPNFLARLKSVAHGATHPTSCLHQYFVDGPTSAADVWWGDDQTDKSASDWHTLLVVSLGRGGYDSVWSSSSSCDTGFSETYNATTHPHYCGYYAFDVTDTSANIPSYKWKLGGSSGLSATHGSHLGQPWSKMTIGRLLYSGVEKWVGFIGGGFSKTECSGGGSCDPKGKGFYVVDMSNGAILWSQTHSGPDTVVDGNMDFALAGQPATLDFDNDGFIDTAYIADAGGNVWRFKFCLKGEAGCSQSTWSGSRLFDSTGNVRPIYTKPAVSRDPAGNIWVYFGTGDATDVTSSNAQERFYAVIDTSRTGMYTYSDLKDLKDNALFSPSDDMPQYHGWSYDMPGMGIKILGDPIVASGGVFFTTYAPSNSNNLCEKTGNNTLWGVNYITGAGLFKDEEGNPTTNTPLDDGAPTSVQYSIDEETGRLDLFVGKQPIEFPIPQSGIRTNLLFWRDLRVRP